MGDVGEFWRDVRAAFADEDAERRRAESARRAAATDEYEDARAEAVLLGLELVRHTPYHYSLRKPSAGYDLAIYPGNRRLYGVVKHGRRPPRIEVAADWTLADVVRAAYAAW